MAGGDVGDGWVLHDAREEGACPLPPLPAAKRGCVRVRIHQRPACKPMTFPAARLRAVDRSGRDYRGLETTADGVTELCGVEKGRYV